MTYILNLLPGSVRTSNLSQGYPTRLYPQPSLDHISQRKVAHHLHSNTRILQYADDFIVLFSTVPDLFLARSSICASLESTSNFALAVLISHHINLKLLSSPDAGETPPSDGKYFAERHGNPTSKQNQISKHYLRRKIIRQRSSQISSKAPRLLG